MPSTVEQLSPSRVKLTIEMPFDDLKPSLDRAYKEIAQQVSIPGFRKGKVPAAVIDVRFGRATVLQEAINDALPNAYGAAVEEHKLVPLGEPEVDITKLEDNKLVEFTAEVDVRPDFEVPDIKAIKIEVDNATVSDEDFDQRLDMLRERFATITDVDRAATEGDLVTLDLKASQDGEVLEESEAEGMPYKVGAGGMVEGLDEAVTGMKADEEKTFNATLVGGPHVGEEAEVWVKVTQVQEQELPEVDDEFAQMVSEFDTKEEMLADLRENLQRMARIDQANTARDKVLEAVLEELDFELPAAVVAAQQTGRRDQIEAQLAQAGMSLDQYLQSNEAEDAETAEEFWADLDKRGEEALRAQLLLDKVADDEEIGVEQQELTQMIVQRAMANGVSPEEEAQHMMEHNHMPEWMSEIRRGKALALIVNTATITDADGNPVDIERLRADGTVIEDGDEVIDEAVDVADEAETEAEED